jgi:hypothetical protein
MRAKFRFDRDFDFVAREPVHYEVEYKAGQELVIPKEHAEAAKAAGAGSYVNEAETKAKAKG